MPSQPAPHRKGPAVLHCRAMYAFAGTNEGELPVAENEILQILQNDGSGWVLVSNVGRGVASERQKEGKKCVRARETKLAHQGQRETGDEERNKMHIICEIEQVCDRTRRFMGSQLQATPVQGYVPESYIALVNQHASV